MHRSWDMRQLIIPTLAAIALAGGCAGETSYRGTVAVSASTPDLVSVGPGVSVIADYDEPIFYSNGYYWWNVDGYWYRSTYYTGGWAYVSRPPVALVNIGSPYRYRHYRPHNYTVVRRPVPSHRIKRPVVRDHRADRRRYRY
jgi:hypothetical protein